MHYFELFLIQTYIFPKWLEFLWLDFQWELPHCYHYHHNPWYYSISFIITITIMIATMINISIILILLHGIHSFSKLSTSSEVYVPPTSSTINYNLSSSIMNHHPSNKHDLRSTKTFQSFCLSTLSLWCRIATDAKPVPNARKDTTEDCHWMNRTWPVVKSSHGCRFGPESKPNPGNQYLDPYCWCKKSCTTWDLWNLVNDGINYQPQLVSRISAINSTSRYHLWLCIRTCLGGVLVGCLGLGTCWPLVN